MKDFVKWLGVNEKIAKVVVWLLIIMVTLIIVNTALNSMGLPHYAITYKNLIKINSTTLTETIANCITCIMGYYAIILLIFRVSETKKLLKYALIYLISNWVITTLFGEIVVQVYMFLFFILFPYFYSKKNKKYLIYGFLSYFLNIIIQGIAYMYKAKFLNFATLDYVTRNIISLDYFIIIGMIIIVKEVYLKKRGEKNG